MIAFSEAAGNGSFHIRIHTMHAQNGGSEVALSVVMENGEGRDEHRLVLSTEQYYDLKPRRGEITEEEYEMLEAADRLHRAIRAGENILSYGGNTAQTLKQKLIKRGFSGEIALSAATDLQARGVIDEKRDLRRELERCLYKLWGAKRINTHLWSKGFGAQAMAELPGLLETVDFVENCLTLIRKHYVFLPTDPNEKRKMMAFLSRYGYSLNEIREAMRLFDASR